MKKIAKCMSLVLAAMVALTANLSGCKKDIVYHYEEEETRTGTLRVEIINEAGIPLTIQKLEPCSSNTCGSYTCGSYSTETNIAAGSSRTIDIQCSQTRTTIGGSIGYSNIGDICKTKVTAYYTSGTKQKRPYLGTISSTGSISVTEQADGRELQHKKLRLTADGSASLTITLKFVDNRLNSTNFPYVLAVVQ